GQHRASPRPGRVSDIDRIEQDTGGTVSPAHLRAYAAKAIATEPSHVDGRAEVGRGELASHNRSPPSYQLGLCPSIFIFGKLAQRCITPMAHQAVVVRPPKE